MIKKQDTLKRIHNVKFVLVETTHPGNIGATARAIKNMGFQDLTLVAPKCFPSAEATARASGADDILANAVVVDTLQEALKDSSRVYATSARRRTLDWEVLTPKALADNAAHFFAEQLPSGPDDNLSVAVVFGREHAGLTNDELQLAHYHIAIPTHPEYPSLNLSQAVQVIAYELRLGLIESDLPKTQFFSKESYPAATADELEKFYEHLEEALIAIGFLFPDNPRHLMSRMRRLFSRASMDNHETNMLRGVLKHVCQKAAIAKQIQDKASDHDQ